MDLKKIQNQNVFLDYLSKFLTAVQNFIFISFSTEMSGTSEFEWSYIFELYIFRSTESRAYSGEVTAQVGCETRPPSQKRKLQNNRGYE